MRWTENRACSEKCTQNCTRKPEVKRSLGRSIHGWEDNIKKELKEMRVSV
jgi:hypothetical protein